MAGRFQDQVALITGASSGIGAAVARELAREGAHLALLARRADKLAAVCTECEACGVRTMALPCDVRDRASVDAAVQQAVAHFGRLDLVLANAGFGVTAPLDKLTTDDFRRQFDTNFFGLLETVYATLPHLKLSRGRLGLVGSSMGRMGLPASGPYTSSKFAVVGLAESIDYDLRRAGISVTVINPGLVESEIRSLDNAGEQTGKPDPAPSILVMSSEKAARQIVRALHRRQFELVVTKHARAILFLARHLPRTTRFLLRTANGRRQFKAKAGLD
ncbi:MAG: SDR family NAD(P)-dependent oxidoreductase [Candidatus Hydrogenedentes bacterium]|nr:SDR family NAD(P)-dependent oxidoreductase [Candidatus Hydrogenedentota bacterium]